MAALWALLRRFCSFFLPCGVTKVGQMIVTKSKQEEKMGTKKKMRTIPLPQGLPRLNWAPKRCNGESGRETNNKIIGSGGQLTLLTPAALFDIALFGR
jgi:hypothetical protein